MHSPSWLRGCEAKYSTATCWWLVAGMGLEPCSCDRMGHRLRPLGSLQHHHKHRPSSKPGQLGDMERQGLNPLQAVSSVLPCNPGVCERTCMHMCPHVHTHVCTQSHNTGMHAHSPAHAHSCYHKSAHTHVHTLSQMCINVYTRVHMCHLLRHTHGHSYMHSPMTREVVL